MTTLDRIPVGGRGRVATLTGADSLVQRLYELGMLEGELIEVIGQAPLGDPIEVRIGGTTLSLRRREAACITVDSPEPA